MLGVKEGDKEGVKEGDKEGVKEGDNEGDRDGVIVGLCVLQVGTSVVFDVTFKASIVCMNIIQNTSAITRIFMGVNTSKLNRDDHR